MKFVLPDIGPLEPIDDLRATMTKQFVDRLVADQEKLSLDMILRGMFVSSGWSIGYHIEMDGSTMKYVLFPVPPRDVYLP